MTTPAPAASEAPGRVCVLGTVLHTDRPLPGLPVASPDGDGQFPFWHLHTGESAQAPAHSATATITGRLTFASGPVVTVAAGGAQTEIVITDTGRFTIDHAAHTVHHLAPAAVDRAAVALDLIGVVLPYALHRDGAWCLHASAVQAGAGVVAFIAARGTGKSTLAAACVQEGCALVADDVVVLRQDGAHLTVTPTGVPLRLRADTAAAVGIASDDTDGWGKVRVPGVAAAGPLPLAAIYCLSAASADADIARVPRTSRAAALALLTNGKITELLGGMAAAEALARCVSLAECAPVYDLAVPRDLARLPEVVRAVCAWHTADALPSLPA